MTQTFDTPLFTTDQGVDRLLHAGLPVLLTFVSGGPSAELKRELERIARERAGRLLVAQADLKDAAEAARRFGVSRLPAVVDARGGVTVAKGEGVSPDELEAHARFLLGEGPKPEPKVQEHPAQGNARGTVQGFETAGPSEPIHVTDASFESAVLRSSRPVLVDFWAPWCGPCRITNPMLERLAREQAGKIIVAKVNVDENPHSAERYGIQSIPTMLVVKRGVVIDQWTGALPEPALRSRVASVLS